MPASSDRTLLPAVQDTQSTPSGLRITKRQALRSGYMRQSQRLGGTCDQANGIQFALHDDKLMPFKFLAFQKYRDGPLPSQTFSYQQVVKEQAPDLNTTCCSHFHLQQKRAVNVALQKAPIDDICYTWRMPAARQHTNCTTTNQGHHYDPWILQAGLGASNST